jgi:hypothetical protein
MSQERLAGCSKWPSSAAAASEEARRTLRYVEPLSDARTKLADFFSILLESAVMFQEQQPAPSERGQHEENAEVVSEMS